MKNGKGSSPKKSIAASSTNLGLFARIGYKGRKTKVEKDFKRLISTDYNEPKPSKLQKQKLRELRGIIDAIESRESDKITIPEFGDEYKIDYRKELNKQQLAAVVTTEGPLLVIAGAGTGKTHLLAYRALYLIESGTEPSDILVLTFTRKAAREMIDRINKNRRDSFYTEVSGGTFHSLAVRTIREYHTYFEISPNFTIADTSKSESIISLAISELELRKDGKEFPSRERVYDIISKSRNTQMSISDIIKDNYTGLKDKIAVIEEVYEWYADFKKNSNMLDFDDLMIVFRDTLREDEDFREIIQSKYRYIMVDEYQDTNMIQKEIIDLMANEDQNVMVVGDDAQSIYAFRGANYENILRFPETYPDCKIIKLKKNYRSLQKLIDFTNSVNNTFKLGYKKLLKAVRNLKGEKPVVKKFMTQEDEAKYIVDKIIEHRESEIPYEKMAVLCRSAWFWQHVEKELNKRMIPYVTVGGTRFVEKSHIQDMLAYLTVLYNPRDAVAWHRILKLIPKVGGVTAGNIVTEIHDNDGSLVSIGDNDDYPKGVTGLLNMLDEAGSDKKSVSDKIATIKEYYKPILEIRDDNPRKSLLDIGVFQDFAEGYDDLGEMLSDFSLDPFEEKFANDVSPSKDESEETPVTLSTVHSAKGLEWGVVFIPHMLDGLFPSSKALDNIEDLEEENRVFYVAATRAEDHLYITMPSSVGTNGKFYSMPSRFLVKIDKKTYGFSDRKKSKNRSSNRITSGKKGL